MSEVLPCITCGARTTWPPYTWPMHWWPRHTPSTGTRPAKVAITSLDTPASSGVPGPGRDQHGVGLERLELGEGELVVAVHERLGAELAQVLHEVVDEAVVVVDHQHPGGHGRDRNRGSPRTHGQGPRWPSPTR